jgi:preprotein translocase subunit SecG
LEGHLTVWTNLLTILLLLCSVVLIFLVLIQRGKGGGLAGAFGGAGGSSAFGTKAGDVFTKVTMYVAGIWILLSMFLVLLVNQGRTSAWVGGSGSGSQKVSTSPIGTKAVPRDATGQPSSGVPEAQSAPAGSVPPPLPSGSSPPVQPVNPGDPLAPIPSPLPSP